MPGTVNSSIAGMNRPKNRSWSPIERQWQVSPKFPSKDNLTKSEQKGRLWRLSIGEERTKPNLWPSLASSPDAAHLLHVPSHRRRSARRRSPWKTARRSARAAPGVRSAQQQRPQGHSRRVSRGNCITLYIYIHMIYNYTVLLYIDPWNWNLSIRHISSLFG